MDKDGRPHHLAGLFIQESYVATYTPQLETLAESGGTLGNKSRAFFELLQTPVKQVTL